ncbi:IclR family transcriptional regulator [Natrinema sp. 1APR25-10V2]|uniref:IclR family transcriptional regulator n=1 Tax=Natrinema sp. 1APR25-10V2 TaxID=2951081 RepID=UPI0028757B0A|nr:IclR family transcriptional regulator [Natrinema sp. 1APR25-10V2]MDS0475201.1 IclR family transcriptional regulator [Natrinema sp. 1APR25-10V2]
MSNGTDDVGAVRATATSFEILEYLQQRGYSSLSTIADELDIAKSTVHRHLKTLEQLEYIVGDADEFAVGLRFLGLAEAARSRGDAVQLAREKTTELAAETNERAQFVVEEHGYGVCVSRATGDHAVETAPQLGSRMPMHATAAGKAILAFESEERVKQILEERRLDPVTSESITDEATLYEELATIREQGYAVNREEHIAGLTAFGAPVRRRDGSVVGAFSISGPTNRFTDPEKEREIATLLLGTTNELELNIAHSVDSTP